MRDELQQIRWLWLAGRKVNQLQHAVADDQRCFMLQIRIFKRHKIFSTLFIWPHFKTILDDFTSF